MHKVVLMLSCHILHKAMFACTLAPSHHLFPLISASTHPSLPVSYGLHCLSYPSCCFHENQIWHGNAATQYFFLLSFGWNNRICFDVFWWPLHKSLEEIFFLWTGMVGISSMFSGGHQLRVESIRMIV